MNVRVRLSAGLAPAAGTSRLSLTLTETATVADLLDHLRDQYPMLASKITSALPMVSGRPAALSDRLVAEQEVALLLPAAGGSS
jgi:molybdopterin converting factor small subunit